MKVEIDSDDKTTCMFLASVFAVFLLVMRASSCQAHENDQQRRHALACLRSGGEMNGGLCVPRGTR